jgi:hypothetical protein
VQAGSAAHLQRVQQGDLPVRPGDGKDQPWQAGTGADVDEPRRCCCPCCCACRFSSCGPRRLTTEPTAAASAAAAAAAAEALSATVPLILASALRCRWLAAPLRHRRLLLCSKAAVQCRQQRQAVVDVPLVSLFPVCDGCTQQRGSKPSEVDVAGGQQGGQAAAVSAGLPAASPTGKVHSLVPIQQ